MLTPLAIIYFISGLLSLLLAVGLLTSRALKPLCARLLGANYALYTLLSFLATASFSGLWPPAGIGRALLATALGPLLHGYCLSILCPEALTRRRQWLHLLLPLTLVVLWTAGGRLLAFIDLLIILSLAGYWLGMLVIQIRHRHQLAHLGEYTGSARLWLAILTALMLINLVVDVAATFEIHNGTRPADSWALLLGGSGFVIVHLITLMLALARAPVIEWMHGLKDFQPRRPGLSDAELRTLLQRWETEVTGQRLYHTEQNMTLTRAGRLLGVPARQLSQAINSIYGASFTQYLNDRRVAEAERLLQENPAANITDLMLEAGFATKSHFHKEFTRVTGKTPSEYRTQS